MDTVKSIYICVEIPEIETSLQWSKVLLCRQCMAWIAELIWIPVWHTTASLLDRLEFWWHRPITVRTTYSLSLHCCKIVDFALHILSVLKGLFHYSAGCEAATRLMCYKNCIPKFRWDSNRIFTVKTPYPSRILLGDSYSPSDLISVTVSYPFSSSSAIADISRNWISSFRAWASKFFISSTLILAIFSC